ncbi:Daunorubicin resistance ATP-binding protein drrA [Streptococcus pyogenes]|nr:Daunorubicin resistance ATP-binding protein drrA [Streptococcus pyogenes]
MVMIEVSHLQKNFSKTIKEPGLKGALKSFVHPQREIFDYLLRYPKGKF